MTEKTFEILLIEDNPNGVELARHALKASNFTHVEAMRDGAEAWISFSARANMPGATPISGPRSSCSI
ncbi:MAG: hypothetical protein ACREQP_17870 [Candidatus Binatia bacterium]